MNIYDTKPVNCSKCGKSIGEIDYDAVVTLPKCGHCANPVPEGDDKALYVITKYLK
ncbi:MAG: hypothetical protein WDZ43_06275 [Nitrosopumilaceae archaeon]|jgi:hypothetical protein